MISVFNNALSGLTAASRGLAGQAQNIAHTGATGRLADDPFRLVDTAYVSRAGGGVDVVQTDRDPSSVPVYQPGKPYADAEGLVAAANVDPAAELVGTIQSRAQFMANLRVLDVANELAGFLLDKRV